MLYNFNNRMTVCIYFNCVRMIGPTMKQARRQLIDYGADDAHVCVRGWSLRK